MKYKEVRKEAWNAFVVPTQKNDKRQMKEGQDSGEEKAKETTKKGAALAKKNFTPDELEKKKNEAKMRKIKEK